MKVDNNGRCMIQHDHNGLDLYKGLKTAFPFETKNENGKSITKSHGKFRIILFISDKFNPIKSQLSALST